MLQPSRFALPRLRLHGLRLLPAPPLHIGLLREANKAEAIAVVAVVRVAAAPEGNLRVVSIVVPRTTALTAVRAGRHT